MILNARIMQVCGILTELRASKAQVCAKAETRGLQMAFVVAVALAIVHFGCMLFVCLSLVSDQTKWTLKNFDNPTFKHTDFLRNSVQQSLTMIQSLVN